jgi:hypothetical protein
MIRVAILRDMFLPLYSSIIKVNTMNHSFTTDASPEPEGVYHSEKPEFSVLNTWIQLNFNGVFL